MNASQILALIPSISFKAALSNLWLQFEAAISYKYTTIKLTTISLLITSSCKVPQLPDWYRLMTKGADCAVNSHFVWHTNLKAKVGWLALSSPLTTWSFIWMHKDFFLIAATPVVKVFLMLVARRKDSWETPSRPAMEPDRTVAPAARLMNKELMIFLWETNNFSLKFCKNSTQVPLNVTTPPKGVSSSVMLTSGSPARGSWHCLRQDSAWRG